MGMVENLKEVVGLVQKLDNIDLVQKILALQNDALDLVSQKAQSEQKVRDLEEELDALKRERITDEQLVFEKNCYWRRTDSEPRSPYCSRCWDVQKSLVRMLHDVNGVAVCPSCKTKVLAWPEERKPAPPRRSAGSNWLERERFDRDRF